MKVKHIRNSWIPKLLKVQAITIYPFIFYAYDKPSMRLMQHEMVHIDQIREKGWVVFYTTYFFEYIKLYLRYRDANKAYFNISYEKEAYANEKIKRKNFD